MASATESAEMDVRYPTFHGDYGVSMIDNAACVLVCNERSAREIDHAPRKRGKGDERRYSWRARGC